MDASTDNLPLKIRRLVEERGWNQEEFSRMSRLNRHTVRQILHDGDRRLRNATIGACARALGLTVSDLRTLPLEKLLPRMTEGTAKTDDPFRRLFQQATLPELKAWLDRNTERARHLSSEETEEILALQGAGGPLEAFGVDAYIRRLERRRKLIQQIHVIAGSEYLDLLEQFMTLLHDKVRPPG